MSSVYDVIKAVRDGKRWSTRRLAYLANIPPTTLESALHRNSGKVSVVMLQRIAGVFGMQWYELLRRVYDHELVNTGRYVSRVRSYIPDDEAKAIVQYVINQPLDESSKSDLLAIPRNQPPTPIGDMIFRQGINELLSNLNHEGLLEAMSHMLEISRNPAYCIVKEN